VDLFEFVTGMITVILALAAAQLFLGIAPLLQTRAKVTLSLTHSAWVAVLFLVTVLHWWSLWDFRDLNWTFPMFGISLVAPGLMFFAATLIFPRVSSQDSVNLSEHFRAISRPFLAVYFVMMVFMTLDGPMFGTEPAFNRLRLAQVTMIALAGLGIVSKNQRVQLGISLLSLAALVVAVAARFLPGVVS